MGFLLFAVTALHVLILILLFVATLDKSWWVLPDKETVNIWYDCVLNDTTHSWLCHSVSESAWLQAVQAFMVLSLLFSSFAFIIFMCQLYTMKRGSLFYATGVFQILTAISVFTAAVIYTVHVDEFQDKRMPGGSFGYCFVLAWLSFPLAVISGIIYIHLRKKE
ncbi:epithelial membrane protein 3 isoform X2 [Anolis carolinensis]|uniref:Epithelial membrane protein 3 n=2 Tax=Anolis carolinensis TaxID=28377 RepID=A0A803T4Z3_ANOCA|nr:PREDICTED: epithelial membrane protein 3 isoform X2 [Anolis carolinensis]XP_003225893.1 PREDICTED: epithelial membrane protein 3 isoform X2 [Anolis carolinensis]XP_008116646.1 PREDICTED: epithelial membrane protein 3 isoform X2 [Anolis carolinensis]XP_008116647.1 PREDICTED: epithelial membrane protein 3 isoform X2 [Anolis carolinensis]|eukprot:XP_003225892.1 PREDICTED: epithelial membrane protein 3 isoform X2 [Anolis carolinensis]